MDEAIKELADGDILVLSSRHVSLYITHFMHGGYKYYHSSRDDNGTSIGEDELVLTWKGKLRRIVEGASSRNATVVFFAPIPEFQEELQVQETCLKQRFRPILPDNCILTGNREQLINNRFLPQLNQVIKDLEGESPDFLSFNSFPVLCPAKEDAWEALENPSHPRENTRVIAGADWVHGQQAARIR